MSKTFLHILNIILLLIATIGLGSCFIFNEEKWLIPFLTIPLLNIILMPFRSSIERLDPLNPIVVIIISLLIGTVLRSFFIISPLESKAKPLMLMGNDPSILMTGLFHIYLGIISFVIGYLICGTKSNRNWVKLNVVKWELSGNKLKYLSIFIIPFSLVCAVLYLRAMGLDLFTILASEDISAKRFLKLEEGGGFSALGYYRKAMDLVRIVFFLLLVYNLQIKGDKKKSRFLVLLIITGAMSIFFHFINSSRSQALEVVLFAFAVIYYIKGKVNKNLIVLGGALGIVLLISMTFLRSQSSKIQNVEKEDPFTIIVGSLNFLGIEKASFIAESMPEKMEFQYGRTLFLWVVAPIPRTMWKDKPEISIGRVIGEEIYEKRDENLQAGGVPPGFITELYMNFGVIGIALGMFLFGYFLKYIYNTVIQVRDFSVFAVLSYVIILIPILIILIGGDLSRSVIAFLSASVPLYLFLRLVKL